MNGSGVLRVPPNSIEAEQAVLGGVMLVPQAWDSVVSVLTDGDFYRGEHRTIFRAMFDLIAHGQPIDAVTVGDWFEGHPECALTGGVAYLYEIANNTPSAANVQAWARVVRDKSLRRALIERATQLAGDAFDAAVATDDLLANSIGALMALQRVDARYEATLRQALTQAYHAAQEARDLNGKIPGLTTGISRLDGLLGGWHQPDLTVIGARPAMGKTALLVKFVLACGVPCGLISAEQPAAQIGARMMSAQSHIPATRFRTGAFEDADFPRLSHAIESLVKRTCNVFDRSAPPIAELASVARRWKQTDGIRALFVDYVQRIEPTKTGYSANRSERVGEVVRGLKTIARELEIPVIALAQVNRKVEERPNKRPHMGDLSDSSEIEKEADQVLMLYREGAYYDANGMNERGRPVRPNIAEISVEKNRHGPVGTLECVWLEESMRFEDLVHAA